jgi:hypothetical protein
LSDADGDGVPIGGVSHDSLKVGGLGNGFAILGHALQMQREGLGCHIARLVEGSASGGDADRQFGKGNAELALFAAFVK